MSITEYNGGGLVVMQGRHCIAIAADLRLGLQAQTVSMNFQKVFRMTDRIYLGLSGLATDVQTVAEKLLFRVNMYNAQEERVIQPKAFANMVSSFMYEHRWGPYFVEPLIAGLEKDGTPFLASTDSIGCLSTPEKFVVSGTCTEQLYGVCEAMYEDNLAPEDLFETISQCLINAMDRDALSGWGAKVHVITPEQVLTRKLKTRQD
jgi:20S proteasome subunit beta 3